MWVDHKILDIDKFKLCDHVLLVSTSQNFTLEHSLIQSLLQKISFDSRIFSAPHEIRMHFSVEMLMLQNGVENKLCLK